MSSGKPLLSRRDFLQFTALLGAGAGLGLYEHYTGRLSRLGIPIDLYLPGMQWGHALRQTQTLPTVQQSLQTPVAIIGSGIAGLIAAWVLQKASIPFYLIEGPERLGNAAGGTAHIANEKLPYPRGAHYLPLPTKDCTLIRTLLFEMGIIKANPHAEAPEYDEMAIVHAPEERIWLNNEWQEGLWPQQAMPTEDIQQQKRFFAHIDRLKNQKGNDGKAIFALPSALSSQDPAWRALDHISFANWLTQEGYTAPSLRWYLDYACKDDYGINSQETSAWAGLHYFASRTGQGTIAGIAIQDGVLTWPNGLAHIAEYLYQKIPPTKRIHGMVAKAEETPTGITLSAWNPDTQSRMDIHAQQVICATPLHIAWRLFAQQMQRLGYHAAQHQPHQAAWQVSNFTLQRAPDEMPHQALAWDNIVYPSPSLGFVHSQHQTLRQSALGRPCVLTAYHAYAGLSPQAARQRLLQQDTQALFDIASQDLNAVYGLTWQSLIDRVEITLRGHAMASPTTGFLHNQGLKALQNAQGRVMFAHSDLSGFSIFEEAAWWGEQAAYKTIAAL